MTGAEQVEDEVRAFWEVARVKARLNDLEVYTGVSGLGALQPPAWGFGATPEHADSLLALVLDGVKTSTAGALWDYEALEEEVTKVGDLAIILDGQANPRALIGFTEVDIVPFDQVTAEHAYAEGEGDRHPGEHHQQGCQAVQPAHRGGAHRGPRRAKATTWSSSWRVSRLMPRAIAA